MSGWVRKRDDHDSHPVEWLLPIAFGAPPVAVAFWRSHHQRWAFTVLTAICTFGPWLLLYATVRNEGSPDGYARLASLLAYSLAPAALGLLAAIVWSFTAVKGAAR